MLGLLLARAGVAVTVLEKHTDFLRDFRGDTVHPSTVRVMDELGLGERFARIQQGRLEADRIRVGDEVVVASDYRRMPGTWPPFVAMVPQADFLDLLSAEALREPAFTLVRGAEVTGLIREGGRVAGVRCAGGPGQVQAVLTVGCDGRRSVVRRDAALPGRELDVPMDVWQVRVPKGPGHDGEGLTSVHYANGRSAVTVDRGDYYQTVYEIPKGSDARLRARPIQWLRGELAEIFGYTDTELAAIRSWDDVLLLETSMSRLRRWYAEGVLCLGDAAHTMSPVMGLGVNLAVQDAVAAARILAGPLRRGEVSVADLARVQRRRHLPARLSQRVQQGGHDALVRPALEGRLDRVPAPLRLVRRFPRVAGLSAYVSGVGIRPEPAPAFARRPPVH